MAQQQSGDVESPSRSSHDFEPKDQLQDVSNFSEVWQFATHKLAWMPPWCRWTPDKPPVFSVLHNILFAFAGAFTVANLYYNHPILNILAAEFHTDYATISRIPTLMQAGYAVGLLCLCPLGDLLRRRFLTLTMVFLAATLWIGLCITKNFTVFSVISFLTAVVTVTPQIMIPLVADLAPPHRRATTISIIVSGNLLGILLARILSGIVTQYTSWRSVYWLALGLQYFIWLLLWLFMPDYPSTNPEGLGYFKMLWSMIVMCKQHPILIQSSLISFTTSSCFTGFWTTLTFLLAGPPYHYSTVAIGLFALVGIVAIAMGPVYSKTFINKFVPNVSVLIGLGLDLVSVCIGTYTGTFTVAGPIIYAIGLDGGMQITQVANRNAIYAVNHRGRNRVNTVFMVFTFCGQLNGTASASRLYAEGGWRASGSLSVGLLLFAVFLCVVRGPYEQGWIGWSGGWTIRKRDQATADGSTQETSLGLARQRTRDQVPEPTNDEEKGRIQNTKDVGNDEKA